MGKHHDKHHIDGLWNHVMKYQADFNIPVELPFYYNCDAWLQAKSVVDLGCGNGYYLSKLAKLFPEKSYTGIDWNPYFIELAKKRFSDDLGNLPRPNRFEVGDVYKATGEYDAAIARLLLQHLNDLDKFLHHMSQVLHKNGDLIVIDANDSMRRFVPDAPVVSQFFHVLRLSRREAGYDRDAAVTFELIASDYGFELVEHMDILTPSSIPRFKHLFYTCYRTVFEIVRLDYNVDYDYDALNREFEDWYHQPNSYAQVGARISHYNYKGSSAI